jgi:hypothetical protein
MLVFPKFMLSSGCFENFWKNFENLFFWKINLEQAVGTHKDNLTSKGFKGI